MKHVNKYQTTQNKEKHLGGGGGKNRGEKKPEKITGVNQSITPSHHIQQNNYMHKANCNII
jgi:hypothetical protein